MAAGFSGSATPSPPAASAAASADAAPAAAAVPAATPAASSGKLSLDEAKKSLDKSAETNRNLFFAFNVLLTTALILCLSITDEHLLIGSTTVKIPLISVDLPIWAFASVVPFFVLVVHFDLLHNLNERSHKLHAWMEKQAACRPFIPLFELIEKER
ncbi:hypothetical protein V8J88_11050 [Massilia sp. W12]|uniref:hypothetical protein n=1 Tax=Massilia sp. W12 TaxID=3126507 RepID=UPI0030CAD4CB